MGFSPTKDKVNCPERAREGGLGHDDAVSVDFGRWRAYCPLCAEGQPKARPTPTVLGIPLQRRFQYLLRDRRSAIDTPSTRNAAAAPTRFALLLPFAVCLQHT